MKRRTTGEGGGPDRGPLWRWLAVLAVVALLGGVTYWANSRPVLAIQVAGTPFVDPAGGAVYRVWVDSDDWTFSQTIEPVSIRLLDTTGAEVMNWSGSAGWYKQLPAIELPRDLSAGDYVLDVRAQQGWNRAHLRYPITCAPRWRYTWQPGYRQTTAATVDQVLTVRRAVTGEPAPDYLRAAAADAETWFSAPTRVVGPMAIMQVNEGLNRWEPPGVVSGIDIGSSARLSTPSVPPKSPYRMTLIAEQELSGVDPVDLFSVYVGDLAGRPVAGILRADDYIARVGSDGYAIIPMASTSYKQHNVTFTPNGDTARDDADPDFSFFVNSDYNGQIWSVSQERWAYAPGETVILRFKRIDNIADRFNLSSRSVYVDVVVDGQVIMTRESVFQDKAMTVEVPLPSAVEGVVSFRCHDYSYGSPWHTRSILVRRPNAFTAKGVWTDAGAGQRLTLSVRDDESGQPVVGVVSLRLVSEPITSATVGQRPWAISDPLDVGLTDDGPALRHWLAYYNRRYWRTDSQLPEGPVDQPPHRMWNMRFGENGLPHSAVPVSYMLDLDSRISAERERRKVRELLDLALHISLAVLVGLFVVLLPGMLARLWHHWAWRNRPDPERPPRQIRDLRRLWIWADLSVLSVLSLASMLGIVIGYDEKVGLSDDMMQVACAVAASVSTVGIVVLYRYLSRPMVPVDWLPLRRACRNVLIMHTLTILAVAAYVVSVQELAVKPLYVGLVVIHLSALAIVCQIQRFRWPRLRRRYWMWSLLWRLVVFAAVVAWGVRALGEEFTSYSKDTLSYYSGRDDYRRFTAVQTQYSPLPQDDTVWTDLVALDAGVAVVDVPAAEESARWIEVRVLADDGRVRVWYLERPVGTTPGGD